MASVVTPDGKNIEKPKSKQLEKGSYNNVKIKCSVADLLDYVDHQQSSKSVSSADTPDSFQKYEIQMTTNDDKQKEKEHL